MADHRAHFERWRRRLPRRTAYLVEQVITRLIPVFEAQGFQWYSDYAGGDMKEVAASTIPLQRRTGTDWPTVEIRFANYGRPFFQIDFSLLPPVCYRLDGKEYRQEQANVHYAQVVLNLRKGRYKNYKDSAFGYASLLNPLGYLWFVLTWRQHLDREVDEALSLLPVLFERFDRGIPEAWGTAPFGLVEPHVMLLDSWHITEERKRKKQMQSEGSAN